MAKKKIKDLTDKEVDRICKLQPFCARCSLNKKEISCYLIYLKSKKYWEEHLDKEVEVF